MQGICAAKLDYAQKNNDAPNDKYKTDTKSDAPFQLKQDASCQSGIASQTTSYISYLENASEQISITEYKIEFYQKVKEICKNNASKDVSVWLSISEDCFIAMKKDPSYESWVLEQINDAYQRGPCFGYESWTFLKFGATKSEFKKTTHSFPNRRTLQKMQEKERAAREEIRRRRKKQLEKKILEEKWRKLEIERTYVQLKSLDHRIQLEQENKALRFGTEFNWKDRSASLYAAAKRKASAYESTFLYRDHAH